MTTVLAQLRHLYSLMVSGHVQDTAKAARGLLGPQIEALEKGAAIEVKPLIWTRHQHPYPGHDWWTAEASGVTTLYGISSAPAGDGFAYNYYTLKGEYRAHTTLEAAQDEAQQEWATFIRAALES